MKLKDYIIKNWAITVFLLILAAIFFVGTSSFNYFNQSSDYVKWTSPDETGNYFFSKLYAQTGELKVFEKYNLYAFDLIHPRSLRSDFGFLKPVSFLGIILTYGKIGSVLGYQVIPYLTPFFGALGLIFFYLIIKEIFDKRVAVLSAAILTFFPVYVYYSCRSMFHNVLFIVWFLAALYFIIRLIKAKKLWENITFSALAGIFLGLAIITRTSEILWLAPVLLIIWLFNFKKITLTKVLVFMAFTGFSILPALCYNLILYGSMFSSGYSDMNQSWQGVVAATQSSQSLGAIVTKVRDTIFYFGFKPLQSLKMFYYYFADMFFWLFWPATLGFIVFLFDFKKIKKKHITYLLSLLVLSVILILYYGSWKFTDNPDPKRFTIGNSYTRYWLPIYLGAIPFLALLIDRVSRFICRRRAIIVNSVKFSVIFILALWSINFVIFGSEEGLAYVVKNTKIDKGLYQEVMNLTEKNAVIITQYHDKLLFPDRKVIVGLLTDDNMNYYYSKLVPRLPVYYLNFVFPEKDYIYLRERKLPKYGITFTLVKRLTREFALYRIDLY